MAVVPEGGKVVLVYCKSCKLDYNGFFHKSCPYCTPGIINPLRK